MVSPRPWLHAHRSPGLPWRSQINLPQSVERSTIQDCRINIEQSRPAGGGWSLSAGFSPEARRSCCTSSPPQQAVPNGKSISNCSVCENKGMGARAAGGPRSSGGPRTSTGRNRQFGLGVRNQLKSENPCASFQKTNKNKCFSCHLLNLLSH